VNTMDLARSEGGENIPLVECRYRKSRYTAQNIEFRAIANDHPCQLLLSQTAVVQTSPF